jgi:hypothetical protein
MLTLAGPSGLLLDARQLALDHGQLLLKGLLGLSSACSDSRSEIQDQDLAKHAELVQGNDEDLLKRPEFSVRKTRLPVPL